MPPLNVRHRQPLAAFWYSTLGAILLSVFMLLLGLFLIVASSTHACTDNACVLVAPLMFLFSFSVGVILSYPILYYLLFTYELSDGSITVNKGIIFRQYETIHFDKIQAIDNERGPLLMLFGITLVKIWTASADQLVSGMGKDAARIRPRPDMTLILGKDEAAAVRDFAMRSIHH